MKILEAHIEYNNTKLTKVCVLADCTDYYADNPKKDIREYFATDKVAYGYFYLPRNAKISDELLEKVVQGGFRDEDRTHFKKSKYLKK